VETGQVSFQMLHKKDNAPLERKYVCAKDDKVVSSRQQARGFQVGKDDYVIITDSELESLAPERSRSIEIDRFVDIDDIDPIYFNRPYYLVPDEGSERPYTLLVQALAETRQAGIAKFVMKAREYLVAILAVDEALCLITLHFERQRVSAEDITPEKTRVSHDELDELSGHIRKATRKFNPGKFRNEYEIELMKIVRKKAQKEGAVKSPKAKTKKIKKQKAVKKVKETLKNIRD
jgi:DNA end-binding protein Ku